MNEPMNDDFFEQFHQDPPDDFAQELWARLTVLDALDKQEKLTPTAPRGLIYRIGQSLRGTPAALVAAGMAILFAGIILLNSLQPQSNNLSQIDPISLANLRPITQSAIRNQNIQLLRQLGRGTLYDMAWSPDESTIAVASGSGVYLHDARDFSDLGTLPGTEGKAVRTITYSRDGTKIAAFLRNSQEIVIWEAGTQANTYEVVERIPTEDALVTELTFNETADQLGVTQCTLDEDHACNQYGFYVREIGTGQMLQGTGTYARTEFIISPDWSILIMLDSDDRVLMFQDMQTGETLKQFDTTLLASMGGAIGIRFSPDSTQIAINIANSGTVRFYEVAALLSDDADETIFQNSAVLQLQLPANGSMQMILDTAFSPDGAYLFASAFNGSIFVWSLPDGALVNEFPTTANQISQFVMNADGSRILTFANGVHTLQTPEITVQASEYTLTALDYLSFSENHDTLVASGKGYWYSQVYVWDLQNTEPDLHVIQSADAAPQFTRLAQADINGAGDEIVYHRVRLGEANMWNDVEIYNLRTGEFEQLNDNTVWRDRANPIFEANGDVLMLVDDASTMELERWLRSDAPQQVGDIPRESVTLRRTNDLSQIDTQSATSNNYVLTSAYTSDQSLVATSVCSGEVDDGVCNAEIRVWDINSGTLLLTLRDSEFEFTGYETFSTMSFSPDGNTLAVGSCFEYTLESNGQRIRCQSSGVRLWDVSAAYARLDIQDESEVPIVEPLARIDRLAPYPIPQVAFSPAQEGDTLLLAVADNDDTTFYNVNTQTGELGLIDGIVGVGYPQFSPDGELLALTRNGVIELWGVPEQ